MANIGGMTASHGRHYHNEDAPQISQQPICNEDFDPYEMQQDAYEESYYTTRQPQPEAKIEIYATTQAAKPSHERARSWTPWMGRSTDERVQRNLEKRFRNKWSFYHMRRVLWPRRMADTDPETSMRGYTAEFEEANSWEDPKGEVVKTKDGKYEYRNEFHQVRGKFKDTAVYLSPTHALPRRLVVQATGRVLASIEAGADTGDWIRTNVKGNVPAVLKISEWALGPLDRGRWWDKIHAALRMVLVSVPLQVMLAMPFSDWDSDSGMADTYTEFQGYHWDWPKYSINVLDEAPGLDGKPRRLGEHTVDVRRRSIRPHRIVVRKGDEWVLVDAKSYPSVRYVFISYQWKQFQTGANGEADQEKIQRMARQIATEKGYKAYWLDIQCITPENGLDKDHDVYTMCDIVRSSGLVAILLTEDTEKARMSWGSRLWTLPEGMLAPGDSVVWCYERATGVLHHDEVHKTEMTSSFWGEPDEHLYEGGSPIRSLAEHYSGLLTLSRLELLPSIINALAAQGWTNKQEGHSDLAYAVMGFLHYRLERNPEDTLFQNLARLSLSNDSDQIIERMVSILPQGLDSHTYLPDRLLDVDDSDLFRGLAFPDQFGTRLHGITPLCDVVGVAHADKTVIIDNAKAIHIRWKRFPRPIVERHRGMKKIIAAFFVAAGLWWLLWGLQLIIQWLPFWADWAGNGVKITNLAWLCGAFLIIAVLLSAAAPLSVRRLFGGKVEKSSPNLVAFEGVMPICELEKIVFGNNNGRLTYAPSSTPLCALPFARHPRERRGQEAHWISHPETTQDYLHNVLPRGHRLFTLVDMGDLSVSIFSAERPPTVALLCGREGGMVRAVLCSWRFENDCLYKETVIRVPSTVYESATPKGWLKVCLQTQNQARWKSMRGSK
ncbi:hypothetical protein N8I77_001563 [Diaporthe amygdali]|uniref:Heterokaryon incompatibility domain-containing protein n=1 Tax=Phomopsis amygdali TaxID=1214568 RepID=A0AAD9W8E6_PHOAM|nr:hypothetical protein N8I77_001563 [Diaporthe amygdali]